MILFERILACGESKGVAVHFSKNLKESDDFYSLQDEKYAKSPLMMVPFNLKVGPFVKSNRSARMPTAMAPV